MGNYSSIRDLKTNIKLTKTYCQVYRKKLNIHNAKIIKSNPSKQLSVKTEVENLIILDNNTLYDVLEILETYLEQLIQNSCYIDNKEMNTVIEKMILSIVICYELIKQGPIDNYLCENILKYLKPVYKFLHKQYEIELLLARELKGDILTPILLESEQKIQNGYSAEDLNDFDLKRRLDWLRNR